MRAALRLDLALEWHAVAEPAVCCIGTSRAAFRTESEPAKYGSTHWLVSERADFMTLRAYNDAELSLALAHADAALKRSEQAVAEADSAEAEAAGAVSAETAAP
jgi:hypothetical protein